MADFMGPRESRLRAHVGLCIVGALLVVVGTALSNTLWPAVIAMLIVGLALQFGMVLGGQFALGNNAAIIAFVVCVMVPAGPEAIGSRVAGWLVAMIASALVATFIWPRTSGASSTSGWPMPVVRLQRSCARWPKEAMRRRP
jgi:hypothetical protein